MLFLEADEETLLDRFKETRRRHPLAPNGRVLEGIRAEREVLGPLREHADVVMDTSDLTGAMLRRRVVTELLGPKGARGRLAATIITFGFKNGPPREADLVLDVRFLPNPHYREDLRPLTGRDPRWSSTWRPATLASEFYARLFPLLDFLLPAYVTEGKTHLTIAIGCTGGKPPVADRRRPDRRAPRRPRRRLAAVVHRDVELD